MIIQFVYTEEYGEIEGMFDEEGTLLGAWSCNDASWRNEYYAPFLLSLGIVVRVSQDQKLVKKLVKHFNE